MKNSANHSIVRVAQLDHPKPPSETSEPNSEIKIPTDQYLKLHRALRQMQSIIDQKYDSNNIMFAFECARGMMMMRKHVLHDIRLTPIFTHTPHFTMNAFSAVMIVSHLSSSPLKGRIKKIEEISFQHERKLIFKQEINYGLSTHTHISMGIDS